MCCPVWQVPAILQGRLARLSGSWRHWWVFPGIFLGWYLITFVSDRCPLLRWHSQRVSTWVFPSFDTYSCMSVNVLSSPIGSNAVTNSFDRAAAMTKSPQRALTMALPLVIWVAVFGSYMLMATDQQRNRYTWFLIIIWVLQCHPELEPRYWLKSVQDGRHLEFQDVG